MWLTGARGLLKCGAQRTYADGAGMIQEPLCVNVRTALHLLDMGRTRLYQLLDSGQIDSFMEGPKSRKIVYASLKDFIARHVEAEQRRPSLPVVQNETAPPGI